MELERSVGDVPKQPKYNNRLKKIFYSKKIAPYLFVLPFIISFLLLYTYPLIQAVIMSFQQVLPGQTFYIGLENYRDLLNITFYRAVRNTAMYTFWTIIVLIPLPLIFAVFLNSKVMRFKNFFRAAIFIPALTSVIVAGTIFRLMFGEMETSLANQVTMFFGGEPKNWRMSAGTGMFLMVFLACWRWMGVNILYFLAGLQNIPNELYESAEMDGAGPLLKFYYITLPFLKPVTIYVTTISIFAGFRMFEESFVYWQTNSPGNIGLTVVQYLYQQGFQYNNMGLGSAIGVVLLVIIFIVSVIYLLLTGAFKREA
ncbi:carbohydrate ABC transporter permease [Evansella sp. AB-rgal1]|uniref:carbohydrate ABC transporter permease n=1 Tax=Evansella sp. AB-rgal1 TaxID=3242696 RepID=UPI00359E4476